jgi:hypothetical protein
MTKDGRMDGQRHNIIHPVLRRAYKNHMRFRLHGNIVLHATRFMQLVASCKQAFTCSQPCVH